jgi:Tfp pilus assembly protein PilF
LYWLNQALERSERYQPAHKALAEYFEKKGAKDQAAAHRRFLNEPDKKTGSP